MNCKKLKIEMTAVTNEKDFTNLQTLSQCFKDI